MGNYISRLGFQALIFSHAAMHCSALPATHTIGFHNPTPFATGDVTSGSVNLSFRLEHTKNAANIFINTA
ncbi:hypothetical protein DSO57_1035014 [Entomophthora muscae]|uniref:Uncharacterized protein n=1 Tax=Entomophthora muscae TaxID=34485 RepID=A0ACC2SNJ1_9FUNG|nr:hypothetical protein DSO57_1035014 [Entomophthora muscae]